METSDSEDESFDDYEFDDDDDNLSTLETLRRIIGVDITLEDVVELMAAVEMNIVAQNRRPRRKKNETCKFFLMNRCNKGEYCSFRHDVQMEEISTKPTFTQIPKRKPIPCKFFQSGSCFKGIACTFSHALERDTLSEDSTLKEGHEQSCSICLENVVTNHKRFGLLSGCDHVFCLECIREWRKQADSEVVRTCPLCRQQSHYVIPSDLFVTGEAKKSVEITYRKTLNCIPCKYFAKIGKCPFGENCFYGH